LTTKVAMGSLHQPVLVDEVVAQLAPQEGAGLTIVDGTVGGAGHTLALAQRVGPRGRLIGLDRDPAMLSLAESVIQASGSAAPVTLLHAAYGEIRRVLDDLGIDRVHGVLLDLGLSSDQLGWKDRGFSFSTDGPLDMRFDPNAAVPTAAELVNQLREDELARLFFNFGEEQFSRRIAHRIVKSRQAGSIHTTFQLADLVRQSVSHRARYRSIDPATRVFQALRIAVNDELAQLETVLQAIPELLLPGGRAAVISFHSLEDRRVKWAFKTNSKLAVLTKKPVTATAQEVAVNPRARSAKMRVVEQCPNRL
jgi:16S rRNA (cytosine1402-N4)-methyltransferase